MEQQINLVGKTDPEAFSLLATQFASTSAKDALVVTLGNNGEGILIPFQDRFWGEFEWHPLHVGPPSWQFILTRSPTKLSKRTIGEFLGADHHRCDELFIQMENASQAKDVTGATTCFTQFKIGMNQHFAMEETVFFPAFERATGMTQGPTMVMRMEHRQMLGLIGQAAQALEQGKWEGVSRAGSTLMILMRQHNIKEEQMLYPMADQHMGDADVLVRSMQKLAPVNPSTGPGK
ncbi:MAG: Hemerythrin HHE cation binding domain protein [Magnetococcales bacterium]|nr:Hemerythrin HHE cation binding domain protein [Magnetococcales bacterium]HIJ83807.1 hemerythrin domain-containing protein [Magnetococcales bacterium]